MKSDEIEARDREDFEITDELSESGEKIPAALIGATVLRFGSCKELRMEEGGLLEPVMHFGGR